ncbi:hypothetical protein EZX63_17250 [Salmonella enterica subsp. enterica serovar Oranienburg]|nr:hypothetical protein [Salmonella enterica]EBR8189667.1 hypothetical protein [Salmonella enterica subsp. enterica serovar Oranienburg]EAO9941764.1 hypothetical protein [Salmonella enterica]EAR9140252.1 hypothetical protein [Salmonella enterica]EAW1068757.1 hypothetical protein [Salmonella enterica]
MVLPQHTLFFRFVGKLSRALTFIFKLLTGDVNFAPRHRMLNGNITIKSINYRIFTSPIYLQNKI